MRQRGEPCRLTDLMMSQPGIREDLDQARRDIVEGNTTSGADLRREFGLPSR